MLKNAEKMMREIRAQFRPPCTPDAKNSTTAPSTIPVPGACPPAGSVVIRIKSRIPRMTKHAPSADQMTNAATIEFGGFVAGASE